MDKVQSAISALDLSTHNAQNEKSAHAFMTTDTVPKFCAAKTQIGGKTVAVGGQAKGVGMIAPQMGALQPASSLQPSASSLHATMLAFLTTDAQVEKPLLQRALQDAVERSFNSVTVDGDTSTNDTCLLLASGASGVQITQSEYSQFVELLQFVCTELAKKIARDGEGATKLVTVNVRGAHSERDAKTVALSIANSPLVKTAIFGNDPNWGRIAMAAGKCGVSFEAAELNISLGDMPVFRDGEPMNFDLAQAEAAMQTEDLAIDVQLGAGEYSWTAWTCDFSYDYVKINAEYHT
jgi:glutamate N-acetyltransferase / amino-acid N-acetyltransferase